MLTTVLLAVFSILGLVMALFYVFRLLKCRSYSATSGIIVSSAILYNVDAFLEFKYQFSVEGINYVATTIYSLDSNPERVDSPEQDWMLKRIVARWPEGKTVTVKYNSHSPAECFLVNGPLLPIIVPMSVSIAFFCILLQRPIF